MREDTPPAGVKPDDQRSVKDVGAALAERAGATAGRRNGVDAMRHLRKAFADDTRTIAALAMLGLVMMALFQP